MNKSFAGKTALVTGSSRGIGKAIAERLAEEGAAVVVNYVARRKEAEQVVEGIEAKDGRAVAIQANLALIPEVRRLFDAAEAAVGRLDIVVANAATVVIKPILECTEKDYDDVFDTNAKGVFFTLQEAARRIRDGGRIIVASTGGTKMFFSQTSLYLGSKGAVEQFVRVLSRELGSRRVTVNCYSPDFTDTELLPERDRAVAAGMSPFNRIGTPDDVASTVVFLASEAGGWITGQNLAAGGGVF